MTYNEYIEPYGFIYVTTNLINGKKYLGQRKFNDGWENYLGSGQAFKKALEKYGRENFSRKIVCVCNSEEELNKAEYDLSVFLDVVNSDDWYNLCYGGGAVSGYKHTDEEKQKMKENHRDNSGENHPMYGKHHTEKSRKKMSDALTGKYCGENSPMYGKHLSDETRKKISDALKGENNPFYGKYHTEESRKKMSENHADISGTKNPNAKGCLQYDKEGNFIRSWDYINQAEDELCIAHQSISACCKGKKNLQVVLFGNIVANFT